MNASLSQKSALYLLSLSFHVMRWFSFCAFTIFLDFCFQLNRELLFTPQHYLVIVTHQWQVHIPHITTTRGGVGFDGSTAAEGHVHRGFVSVI